MIFRVRTQLQSRDFTSVLKCLIGLDGDCPTEAVRSAEKHIHTHRGPLQNTQEKPPEGHTMQHLVKKKHF